MRNGASSSLREEDLEKFYAYLSNGLHAMAQPLTILRSSVAASMVPGITQERHQRYLGISVQQVERACSLFESLQDLVIAKQVEAAASPVGLSEIASQVVAVQESLPATTGLTIELSAGEGLPSAIGDANRTKQALTAALRVVVALSEKGDVVEVALHLRGYEIECSVRNPKPHGKSIDSSYQLILALAEMNIRSQDGQFALSVDPFCVTLTLPAAISGG